MKGRGDRRKLELKGRREKGVWVKEKDKRRWTEGMMDETKDVKRCSNS